MKETLEQKIIAERYAAAIEAMAPEERTEPEQRMVVISLTLTRADWVIMEGVSELSGDDLSTIFGEFIKVHMDMMRTLSTVARAVGEPG